MTTMAWDAQPRSRSAEVRTAHGPAGAPASSAASSASLRLTRRGRLVISVAAGVLALGAGLTAQSAVAESPREALPVETWTVAAGETLWEIAASVAEPGEDRRDVVADLISLNGLAGGDLQAGEQILVPAS